MHLYSLGIIFKPFCEVIRYIFFKSKLVRFFCLTLYIEKIFTNSKVYFHILTKMTALYVKLACAFLFSLWFWFHFCNIDDSSIC